MKKIFIIFLVIILLISCTMQSSSIPKYTSIEESIKLLASKNFDGRKPSTEGNKKTQEYLKKSLESFNLQPYSESYYWDFPYMFYNIKSANMEIDKEKLDYLKDFQIRYTNDSSVNIASTLKLEPVTGKNVLY